ncbi:hypothetical protein H9W95_08195 [Flavobacterium lindanitolerans]|nr:hypothetical protein [Flavobacterium lindanitolerans]
MTLPFSAGSGCFGNGISGVFVYDSCSNVGVNCLAGLQTEDPDEPAYINNLYVEAGHTYIIVISTTFDSEASVCFNFELTFSTCAPPATFTWTNLTTDSVTFSGITWPIWQAHGNM